MVKKRGQDPDAVHPVGTLFQVIYEWMKNGRLRIFFSHGPRS